MSAFANTLYTLNFGLCVSVLVYLWLYRRDKRHETVEHRILTEPILTPAIAAFLFRGTVLWSLGFLFAFKNDHILFRDLQLAFFTAGTMYIVHGLTYLTAFPVREGGIAPSLKQIDSLRSISIVVLVIVTMFTLITDFPKKNLAEPVAGMWSLAYIYPLWMFVIFLHTYWNLRFSEHQLRNSLLVILGTGAFYALTCLLHPNLIGFHLGQTFVVGAMLWTVYRAALLQVDSAYDQTDFFRREKEVLTSFITAVTGEESLLDNTNPSAMSVGTLDLDYLMKTTLRFSMELTEAGAGAIFMFPSYEEKETGRLKWEREALLPRAVEGLYPPRTDITRLPHVSMRQKYINDLLLAERHPTGEGLEGIVAERGESLLIVNALDDPRVLQQKEEFLRVHNALAVPLKVRDEVVGVVSLVNRRGEVPFTTEDVTLLEAMSEQASIAIGTAVMHQELQEKERLQREIELAHEVQRLLLPTQCPALPGFNLAAFSESAQQVGGDYFDFVHHPSGELTIVVADVSGKGVPAALTMAMVRSALRALGPTAAGPKDLLIKMNRFISEDLRRDMFISMLVVTLDPSTKKLRVARAGHDPLLHIFPNGHDPELVLPSGIALGLMRNERFDELTDEVILQTVCGERYALYTDGVTEAMNEEGEEFTLERLLKELRRTQHNSPEEAISAVRQSVAGFVRSAPQHDDLTLLVLDVL